jgi:surface antigen-like variable number repeat protein
MKKKLNLLGRLAVFALLAAGAPGQTRIIDRGKCSGKIFDAREVTRRARIIKQPDFKVIYEAFGRDVHARVSVDAVLCRSGQVTDIRVVQSTLPNVGEFVVAAVSQISFAPAELNWHTVSQRQRFEFSINEDGVKEISQAGAAGRSIERVEIVGNRRLTAKQILAWIKTRPGDIYNSDQITRDFNAVLATGYFDKLKSRVTIEDGLRGGIDITFFVVELPLISEVKFDGLKQVDQSTILDSLLKAHIDVRKGLVFDSAQMKLAIRTITDLLASRGFPNAKVELQIENVDATTLSLTLVISGQ